MCLAPEKDSTEL